MGAATSILHSTERALAGLPPGLVWQASRLAQQQGPVLGTGFAELDAELPGGGWPTGALIELLADQPGVGELSLLLPLLRRTPQERWMAWIAPPFLPYAPALAATGVPLGRLLLIEPQQPDQILWATRQAVSSGSCAAVLAWPRRIDAPALRRLQLAAEDSATPLFLFRPRAAAMQASPAALRIALAAEGDRLRVEILKRRGPPAALPLCLPVRPWQPQASASGNESPAAPGSRADPPALAIVG